MVESARATHRPHSARTAAELILSGFRAAPTNPRLGGHYRYRRRRRGLGSSVRTVTGRPVRSATTLAATGAGMAAGGLMVCEWLCEWLTPRSWLSLRTRVFGTLVRRNAWSS
jgi:hypothetical protein